MCAGDMCVSRKSGCRRPLGSREMAQIQALKLAVSLRDVAALLKFRARALSYILYIKPLEAKYRSFEIAKRRGGHRKINAPSSDLMLLQRNLSDLLQDCVEEINTTNRLKDQLAHGFKRGRSIIDNATRHRRKRWVLNIDLEDFFGTINFGRVRGFFIKDRNFALRPAVATILAQIACHQNSLPQGSPCSPVISNLIGHVLDIRLGRLAFDKGCMYSRYADDITFSTNEPDFPSTIAVPAQGQAHRWEVGNRLGEAVRGAGFRVNPQKTRMQYRASRQDVTGLVVNKKINVRSEYRRAVRAMAHRLFMTGKFDFVQLVSDEEGILVPTQTEGSLEQLHGMLGHINRVDLYNLARVAEAGHEQLGGGGRLGSKENLYRRFLMFKEFYVAAQPVILCEGKTDNVYIQCAIRKLGAAYPSLAESLPNGGVKLRVRIFRYPQTSTGRILRLSGGTGELGNFMREYVGELDRFKAPGQKNAVILVVDNDTGANSIFNVTKQITKHPQIKIQPFLRVRGNLHLVPTPLGPRGEDSIIEDCFGNDVRNLVLGGKSFSSENGFDPDKHFGKHVLSKYVEQNADRLDFRGFAPLLDRIASAIEAHKEVAV